MKKLAALLIAALVIATLTSVAIATPHPFTETYAFFLGTNVSSRDLDATPLALPLRSIVFPPEVRSEGQEVRLRALVWLNHDGTVHQVEVTAFA